MSRFERFSRVSPVQLYHERLRLLRRAALAVLLLSAALAALLLLPGLHTDGSATSPVAPGVSAALCAPSPPAEPESAAIPPALDLTALAATLHPPLRLLPEPAAAEPRPVMLPEPQLDIAPQDPAEDGVLLAAMTAEIAFPSTEISSAAAPAAAPAAPSLPRAGAPTRQAARAAGQERRAPQARSAASSANSRAADARADAAAGSSGSYSPPRYLEAPPPPYPPDMRAGRYSGSVGVLIKVGADGTPLAVHITRSGGRREFDTAARDWILKHWRFHPARRGAAAVAADVKTSVIFRAD